MREDGIDLGRGVFIPLREIAVEYARSSGPGGQHVNKTETRVTLRWPLSSSPSLPEPLRRRLAEKLGPRLTKDGELHVRCGRHRDRIQNFGEAWDRLAALLREASVPDRPRIDTKPTRGSKERRLKAKRTTQQRKKDRRVSDDD